MKFGRIGTHLHVESLKITRVSDDEFDADAVTTLASEANIIVDPFRGVPPTADAAGVFTARLEPAQELYALAARTLGGPARTEVHGIETLPACLEIAKVVLGLDSRLDELWVRNHIIRKPIHHDLDLAAGPPETIKSYRGQRNDKPSLECRIAANTGAEVSVLGYATESPTHRVYVAEHSYELSDILTRKTMSVENPRTILKAVPQIPRVELAELQNCPSKAIIYGLELGQSLIQQHLTTLPEPDDVRNRPLYITRTSNVVWSNPELLFEFASVVELQIHPQVTVPATDGGKSNSHSWLVELNLTPVRHSNSSLKAEMVVVRTPDFL